MSDLSNNSRRAARPERITIGGVEFERNDVVATGLGTTERTVNRDDARGAPFIFFGGVKYRPMQAYHEFLLTKIRVKGKAPKNSSWQKARSA